MALELSVLGRSVIGAKASLLKKCNQRSKLSARLHCPVALSPSKNCSLSFRFRPSSEFSYRSSSSFMLFSSSQHHEGSQQSSDSGEKELESIKVLLKRGIVVGAVVCGVLLYGCRKVLASAGVVEAGYEVFGQSLVLFKNALPKIYQVLTVLREQGLILAALLSLSAFFSMAETSITTLWPWKVKESCPSSDCELLSCDLVMPMLKPCSTPLIWLVLKDCCLMCGSYSGAWVSWERTRERCIQNAQEWCYQILDDYTYWNNVLLLSLDAIVL